MIDLKEYMMGRDIPYPPGPELEKNAFEVIHAVNSLMTIARISRGVRSGYRPAEINAKIPNAAPHSKHMTCQAVDLEDNDGKFKSWCLKNLYQLELCKLWMEAPEATPTWCHLQIVAPSSGHRVFLP